MLALSYSVELPSGTSEVGMEIIKLSVSLDFESLYEFVFKFVIVFILEFVSDLLLQEYA